MVDSTNLSFVGENPSLDKFFYIFLYKLYTNTVDIKESIIKRVIFSYI
jgi:hypothetical protein